MIQFRVHTIDWQLAKREYAKTSLAIDHKTWQKFLKWVENRAYRIMKLIPPDMKG